MEKRQREWEEMLQEEDDDEDEVSNLLQLISENSNKSN